ncbi:MAG: hypothetical protein WBS33_14420, partial [Verrucomicrobiia bacterium]
MANGLSLAKLASMTGFKKIPAVLFTLAILCTIAGCDTTGGDAGVAGTGPIKERGVYTTLV